MDMMTFNLPASTPNTPEAILSALLVGKTLRVLEPGERQDFVRHPNRATVRVDEKNVVGSAFFG